MSEPGLLFSVFVSACAGACAGFCAGLVPGLHMNNVAAALTTYAGAALAFFGGLASLLHSGASGLLVCCFISSALVSHMFAESITSTYLGIPAGDVISVLPAHRLARAGLGRIAVRASADGTLGGIVISCLALLPVCLLMGRPIFLYSVLHDVMGFMIVVFSAVLLVSEGPPTRHVVSAAMLFLASGVLGYAILMTDYNASVVPDLPWINDQFVPRSSLLLPLFAGLFGVPNLLNSLGSRRILDLGPGQESQCTTRHRPGDYARPLLGGAIVGWLPGMTSGSSATLLVPHLKETAGEGEIEASSRFIWMYSFISASGAVFSVGALFVILRARSGSMDAVMFFLGDSMTDDELSGYILPLAAILLSMLIGACISRYMLRSIESRLGSMHRTLCSGTVAVSSLIFIISLSAALTGTRGMLVMSAAVCLGLLPPLTGVRRIQLMGCLLVPITIGFFS